MKAADAVVAIAPNVTAMPASRNRQPASIVARESALRSANAAAAPVPQSRKITSPPHSRFGEPVTWANPLVYVAEGMRGALTPALPHMSLAVVTGAQLVILTVFCTLGLRSFMRRAVG